MESASRRIGLGDNIRNRVNKNSAVAYARDFMVCYMYTCLYESFCILDRVSAVSTIAEGGRAGLLASTQVNCLFLVNCEPNTFERRALVATIAKWLVMDAQKDIPIRETQMRIRLFRTCLLLSPHLHQA